MLPRWVVGHDVVIEVPEDVGRRLGSVWDDASQVDGGPSVDVNVWRPVNPHVRNWQEKSVNNVLQLFVLTNNVESDGIWLRWLGGNLTLVYPSVSLLHVFDQENPLVLGVVLRREPLVGCEGLLPGCQDVDIAMSHPGHLGGVFCNSREQSFISQYFTFCVGFKFFTRQVRNAVFPRIAETFCGWRRSKWVRDGLM